MSRRPYSVIRVESTAPSRLRFVVRSSACSPIVTPTADWVCSRVTASLAGLILALRRTRERPSEGTRSNLRGVKPGKRGKQGTFAGGAITTKAHRPATVARPMTVRMAAGRAPCDTCHAVAPTITSKTHLMCLQMLGNWRVTASRDSSKTRLSRRVTRDRGAYKSTCLSRKLACHM
jgi:hypothetical protein